MKVKIISRKFYYIVTILTAILLFILFYSLFHSRKVENAVLINSDNKSSTFFIEGKQKKFKIKLSNLQKYSVVNFKYNAFKAYSISEVQPIQERVMAKDEDSYDLEISGTQKLASKPFYYYIDSNNSISLSSASKLIVGKNNVRLYKNTKGMLATAIITPIDYSTLRVAISTTGFESIVHSKVEIKAQSSLKIYSKTENYSTEVPEKTILTFEFKNGKTRLSINDLAKDFTNRLYVEGNFIAVTSLKRLDNKTMTPVYSGVMEVTSKNKGLVLINEVSLEDYLTKVVPSEMPSNSSPEALKCQAIAARTYAISDMLSNRFASGGYHVDDSTKSQVYNNIYAQPSTTNAVNSTKGVIMTYNGQPIDAKYYSTSDGTGADYTDIYFNSDGSSDNRPYLKFSNYVTDNSPLPNNEEQWLDFYKNQNVAAIDNTSPYFRWKIVYSADTLVKALNKSLKEMYDSNTRKTFMSVKQNGKTVSSLPTLDNLKDIKVIKRGEAGNIIKLSFIFENAEVEVSGDSNVRYSIKCSEEYAGVPISLIRSNGKSILNMGSIPSSFFSIEKDGKSYNIYGGGYGHGVGMSQYGAMELAKKGMDYKSILNTYYKDINLSEIY